jgi:hypothetical protein
LSERHPRAVISSAAGDPLEGALALITLPNPAAFGNLVERATEAACDPEPVAASRGAGQ